MKNKLIIFSILLILAYCLSAVCAVDVNNVCDNSTINEDNENVVADTPSNNVNCEDKFGIGGNSHQNTLSYGCDDLQNLVDHSADGAILNLNHDYTFSNNKVLVINKGNGHLTINGCGHSIYLDDSLSRIESKDGIIT